MLKVTTPLVYLDDMAAGGSSKSQTEMDRMAQMMGRTMALYQAQEEGEEGHLEQEPHSKSPPGESLVYMDP